jgi:hypothetical protein
MRARAITGLLLFASFFVCAHTEAQTPPSPPETNNPSANPPIQQPPLRLDEIIERMIAREKEEVEALDDYSPIIETYIQEVRPDKKLGIVRLMVTEVLRRLTFREDETEAADNSRKSVELLKKSPYADKLDKTGLFLAQLRAQSKELKHLISPQLGNEVYFEAQLMQAAPALEPNNMQQIAALPMGSRLKIDPWTAGVSLIKSKPTSLLSPRDKMPFEVAPMAPYLTRYVETSSSQKSSQLFAAVK